MEKMMAAMIASTAVAAAQIIGGLRGSMSSHPKTAAWYARLRKPSFTPPGRVFGLA